MFGDPDRIVTEVSRELKEAEIVIESFDSLVQIWSVAETESSPFH